MHVCLLHAWQTCGSRASCGPWAAHKTLACAPRDDIAKTRCFQWIALKAQVHISSQENICALARQCIQGGIIISIFFYSFIRVSCNVHVVFGMVKIANNGQLRITWLHVRTVMPRVISLNAVAGYKSGPESGVRTCMHAGSHACKSFTRNCTVLITSCEALWKVLFHFVSFTLLLAAWKMRVAGMAWDCSFL